MTPTPTLVEDGRQQSRKGQLLLNFGQQMIQLNANAGTQMFASSKAELIKYMDVSNNHNLDIQSKQACVKYEKLKRFTSEILSKTPMHTIMTSTGTEANCLAIKSVIQFYSCQTCDLPDPLHIVTSQYEHKSVMQCLEHLQHEHSPYKRRVEVTYIQPTKQGVVMAEDVLAAVKENTVLVTIMAINNETGADNRQQLIGIGKGLAKRNKTSRLRVLFHSDCVQAFGKYKVPVEEAGIDMASVSYYKVFGPNRIGALVVSQRALDIIIQHPLLNTSLLQSDSTHGGTQSMSLVAAALNSLKVVSINRINKNSRLESLRHYMRSLLKYHFKIADFDTLQVNWQLALQKMQSQWLLVSFSPESQSVPSTFMFTLIRYIDNRLDAPCGRKLLKYFAEQGIIVATGSACGQDAGSKDQGNEVLSALGVHPKLQQSALRVSFCDTTTRFELRAFVDTLLRYLQTEYNR